MTISPDITIQISCNLIRKNMVIFAMDCVYCMIFDILFTKLLTNFFLGSKCPQWKAKHIKLYHIWYIDNLLLYAVFFFKKVLSVLNYYPSFKIYIYINKKKFFSLPALHELFHERCFHHSSFRNWAFGTTFIYSTKKNMSKYHNTHQYESAGMRTFVSS